MWKTQPWTKCQAEPEADALRRQDTAIRSSWRAPIRGGFLHVEYRVAHVELQDLTLHFDGSNEDPDLFFGEFCRI